MSKKQIQRVCRNCEYYAKFSGVCANIHSEWRADFRSATETCELWALNEKLKKKDT